MDHTCKDIDLHSYVKQHKSKRDRRGAFYAIHFRWLGPKHVNMTTSEATMALQKSMYDGENNAWKWEKYVAYHVNYHIIQRNLMECGYHGLDPESKVQYHLNSIRCDKLFTAVATVRACPDKHEKDFDAVFTIFIQYVDKREPTSSVKVTSLPSSKLPNDRKLALSMALSMERLS